jgi:hypothetical protein
VKMLMFFWVVMPCRLVGRYQRFGETNCLHPVIYLRVYTVSHPRRTSARYLVLFFRSCVHRNKFGKFCTKSSTFVCVGAIMLSKTSFISRLPLWCAFLWHFLRYYLYYYCQMLGIYCF